MAIVELGKLADKLETILNSKEINRIVQEIDKIINNNISENFVNIEPLEKIDEILSKTKNPTKKYNMIGKTMNYVLGWENAGLPCIIACIKYLNILLKKYTSGRVVFKYDDKDVLAGGVIIYKFENDKLQFLLILKD